jgi:Cys-tRNA synthase (O-phospho-L-seryl-tRNA:Cys-tRNA synthase)
MSADEAIRAIRQCAYHDGLGAKSAGLAEDAEAAEARVRFAFAVLAVIEEVAQASTPRGAFAAVTHGTFCERVLRICAKSSDRRDRDASGAAGLTVTLPLAVTPEVAERLTRVAEEFGVARTDVQRWCIDTALPELERWMAKSSDA